MNTPLDADAVLRDDALLDAIVRDELRGEFDDDLVARALLAWRADVLEDEPPLELPRRRPVLGISRRMSVAAAVGVTTAVSLGSLAAAGMAEPGSPLWAITKVVYTDRAESIQAREDARDALQKARDAAAEHQAALARRLLAEAQREAEEIRPDDPDLGAVLSELDEVERSVEAMDQLAPSTAPSPPGGQVGASPAGAPTVPVRPSAAPAPSAEPRPAPSMQTPPALPPVSPSPAVVPDEGHPTVGAPE